VNAVILRDVQLHLASIWNTNECSIVIVSLIAASAKGAEVFPWLACYEGISLSNPSTRSRNMWQQAKRSGSFQRRCANYEAQRRRHYPHSSSSELELPAFDGRYGVCFGSFDFRVSCLTQSSTVDSRLIAVTWFCCP
jgi:hypothetical protein